MAETFAHSGESSGNAAVPTPRLQGIFIPGIDTPNIQDGFGLITPLGGGLSARQYTQYGVSNIISPQETQIHDLAITPAEGNIFNFEGLIGPQGIPGPPGAPGLIQIITAANSSFLTAPNSSFLTALPPNIDGINQLGTAANTMIYVSSYDSTFNFVWTKTDIDSVVKSWNDSDINTDASFFIIAADAGIYVSTDVGDSWDKYNPDGDTYEQISCESSGGDAVVLGTDGKAAGTFLITNDYGVNWTEITIPTGEDLTSGTTNGNTLPEPWPPLDPEEREITFDSPVELTNGVTYAIVIRATGADFSNRVVWHLKTSGAYANGSRYSSDDSGSSWAALSSQDQWFQTKASGIVKESYTDSSGGAGSPVWGTNWEAQTFLAESTYTISSVVLRLKRTTGASPGTITVSIRILSNVIIRSVKLGTNGAFIVVAAQDGVYLSTDSGTNWDRKTPDDVEDTDWEKGICSSDGTYIIVVSNADAIYRSANSGSSWAQITPADGDTFSVNKMATSDDGQFMVIVGQNSTDATESCYISTDYGATWTAKKPVAASIEYTECDISNDGTVIAVSTTSYFYISLDSGATWKEQGMASTAEVWKGLRISGDGTTGLVANTNDNDEFFIGINTELFSRATWAESTITSAGRSLLDDATVADQNTTLGFGTGDSPTLTGLTLSSLTESRVVLAGAGGLFIDDTNLTFSGATLSASNLIASGTVQAGVVAFTPNGIGAYKIKPSEISGNTLAITNTLDDNLSILRMFSAKGDLGDIVGFQLFGLGTEDDITPHERLDIWWNGGGDSGRYEIATGAVGGTVRPLMLGVGAFKNLTLNSDGSTTCGETTGIRNFIIPNNGYIGSVEQTDAIQIDEDGGVTFIADITVIDDTNLGSSSSDSTIINEAYILPKNFGTSGYLVTAAGSDGELTYTDPATLSVALAAAVIVANSTDEMSFIAMFDSATGNLPIRTETGLTYNSATKSLGISGDLAVATINDTIAQSLELFKNIDKPDAEDGESFIIHRKSTDDGDRQIEFKISQFQSFLLEYNGGTMGFDSNIALRLQFNANSFIQCFDLSSDGETREFRVYGRPTGMSKQYGIHKVIDIGGSHYYQMSIDGGGGGLSLTGLTRIGDGATNTNFLQVSAMGSITQFGSADATLNLTTSSTQTEWDAAYDNMVTAIAFNTGDGIITVTQQDSGTLLTDSLDGRYFTETELGSVSNGLGASLIGIEDDMSLYAGTNVEAALAEVMDQITIVTHVADSFEVGGDQVGTVTGIVENTQVINDGDEFILNETTGGPNPNFVQTFEFSGITAGHEPNLIELHWYYSPVTTPHTISIQMYNYNTSTWDVINNTTFVATGGTLTFSSITIIDGGGTIVDYTSGGAARVRFSHDDNGIAAHDFGIDYLAIKDDHGIGSGITDHGSMSGLQDDDHDPLYHTDGRAATWLAANHETTFTHADIATNTSKVTNATHTGEVTGSGALTTQPVMITGKDAATVASDDLVLVSDVDDTNILKKVTAQSIGDLGGGGSDNDKVGIDGGAAPGYIGAASNDGVLRTSTPLAYTDGGDFVTISITQAGAATDGYLDSTDWNIFNNKVDNVSTTLEVGTVGVNTVAITSDGGADDVTLPAATVATAGMLTTAKWAEIVANNAKATNVPTALSTGTVDGTSYGITSDSGSDDVVIAQADTDNAGVLSAVKWDEIVANTLKNTNVSTDLSEGTSTETTVDVNSSDGNNATLVSASTTRAGLLTKAKWDEIVVNTTHSGTTHDYSYISGNDGATNVTAAELEELTDASVTTLHSHAGGAGGFVDRGDPAAWDRQLGDLTEDNNWHELDLGPDGLNIVPAGAKSILLQVQYQANTIERFCKFRKFGNGNAFNISHIVCIVIDQPHHLDLVVPCDAGGSIEYILSSTETTVINIVVKGWWL